MAVRATQTFWVAHPEGPPTLVNVGDVFDTKDPIVKGRAELFEDVDEAIERATANPGEKRTTTITGKKK